MSKGGAHILYTYKYAVCMITYFCVAAIIILATNANTCYIYFSVAIFNRENCFNAILICCGILMK